MSNQTFQGLLLPGEMPGQGTSLYMWQWKNIKLDVITAYTVVDANLRQVNRLRVLRHTWAIDTDSSPALHYVERQYQHCLESCLDSS